MSKGTLTGLKALKKLAETGSERQDSFLKLKDGQSVTIRFLQELDESGKYYDESRGLAVTVFEHLDPDNPSVRFLCTAEEEGKCVGCERVVVSNRWKRRSRIFINAWVEELQATRIVASGFSPKGIGGALIEYAEDFNTLCDRNYKLKRNGEGLKTTYTLLPREVSQFDVASKPIIDLSQFTKYRTYDECLAMVQGQKQGDSSGW